MLPYRLTITHTGEPLSIPSDKLFARFQKREIQTEGVGLGLASARKGADASGYTLVYQYLNQQHHFILTFDKA